MDPVEISQSSSTIASVETPFELGVTHIKLIFVDGEVIIPRKIAARIPPIACVVDPVLWFDYKTKEPFLEVFRAVINMTEPVAPTPGFAAEMSYWGYNFGKNESCDKDQEKFCIKCESYLTIMRTISAEARNGTCVNDLCCTNHCIKNIFGRYSNYCQSHVCDDTGNQSHAGCTLVYQHTGPHFDGWEIW